MTASSMQSDTKTLTIPWWAVLIEGIGAVIIGILLLAKPGITTLIIVQLLAVYWFIKGIVSIVSIFIDKSDWGWKLIGGLLGIIVGILIIQHPIWGTLLVPTSLMVMLGLFGIMIGITYLVQAFRGAGWGAGILGALSVIFGLLLLFNPLVASLGLPLVLGIFAIIGGILAIIAAFQLKKIDSEFEDAAPFETISFEEAVPDRSEEVELEVNDVKIPDPTDPEEM